MFVRSRQPLDRSKPYDKGITDVVEMKLESPPFENLIAVCKTMGWKQPDPIEFDVLLKEIAATQVKSEPAGGFKTDENMDEAMSSREKKKAAKQQSKQLAKKQDSSGTQQKKLPPKEPNCDVICYYGICISGASCELLLSSINSALSSSEVTPCNGKSFFFLLQTKKRFSPNRFHITLAINPLRLTLEKNESFVKLSSELFAQYESGEAQRRLLEGEDSGGDGTNTNADLEFKTSHLVWDDRVMCLAIDRVSLSALKITSLNDHPHITIGTANPNIPPSESNLVLGRLAKGDVSVNTLPLSIILHGNIRPYRY